MRTPTSKNDGTIIHGIKIINDCQSLISIFWTANSISFVTSLAVAIPSWTSCKSPVTKSFNCFNKSAAFCASASTSIPVNSNRFAFCGQKFPKFETSVLRIATEFWPTFCNDAAMRPASIAIFDISCFVKKEKLDIDHHSNSTSQHIAFTFTFTLYTLLLLLHYYYSLDCCLIL